MKMIPTTRLGIDVEVKVDDVWWPGHIEHWRSEKRALGGVGQVLDRSWGDKDRLVRLRLRAAS